MNATEAAKELRQVAAGMLAESTKKAEHAKVAQLAVEHARKHGAFEHNGQVFTVEEMERYAKIAADQAAEWSILKPWAKKIQDISFTMKG